MTVERAVGDDGEREREREWKRELRGETWRVHGGRDYIEANLTEMTLVGWRNKKKATGSCCCCCCCS